MSKIDDLCEQAEPLPYAQWTTEMHRVVPLSPEEREELAKLRRKVELCSLGDRPQSPGVKTLRRIAELAAREGVAMTDLEALARRTIPDAPEKGECIEAVYKALLRVRREAIEECASFVETLSEEHDTDEVAEGLRALLTEGEVTT